MALSAFDGVGHKVRLRFCFTNRLSPNKLNLKVMTMGAPGSCLVVATQAFNPCLKDLSVFLPCGVANLTVQYSGDVLLMRKGKVVNLNPGIFKSPVTFNTLGMRNFCCLWQWDSSPWMAGGAGGLFPGMAFETSLFRRPKRRWIVGIVVNVVMASSAGIL